MSGQLYLMGDIRPVNFRVEERGLFAFGFTSGVSTQIETIDKIIAKEGFFSIVPDNSKLRFVGRIRKMREMESMQAAIYMFVVDEIVGPRDLIRKGINERSDVSTPEQD
jgi:hypothetical protein